MVERRRVGWSCPRPAAGSAWVSAVMLSLLVAVGVGCSGGNEFADIEPGDTIPLPPQETTNTSSTASSSTGAASLTGSSTTVNPGPESDLADLEALWEAMWVASALPTEERAPAMAELGDAVVPDVAEGLPTLVLESMSSTPTMHPVFTETADGTVEIIDCTFWLPEVFGEITHINRGMAEPDGEGGWVITGAARVSPGCVPAEIAEQVLDDYDEYVTASDEYWNPPDPDHPGIDQTLTGDFRDLIRERVVKDKANGWYLLNYQDTHPEIVEVGYGWVTVSDCRATHPATGVFDASGELIPGTEPPVPDQRDLYTVTLNLEGVQWKVNGVTINVQAGCQFGPTQSELTIVG